MKRLLVLVLSLLVPAPGEAQDSPVIIAKDCRGDPGSAVLARASAPTPNAPAGAGEIITHVRSNLGNRAPLEHASVALYSDTTSLARRRPLRSVATDLKGYARLDSLHPAGYFLTVAKLGFTRASSHLSIRAGYTDTLHITLESQVIC
jgi:hypothetical protein